MLWTEFVTPLFYAKALTLNVMVLGGGLLGQVGSDEVTKGEPYDGISAFTRGRKTQVPVLSAM